MEIKFSIFFLVIDMSDVDTEVCLKAKCPFVDKENGFCLRALGMRKSKKDVCISNVSIRMDKKK